MTRPIGSTSPANMRGEIRWPIDGLIVTANRFVSERGAAAALGVRPTLLSIAAEAPESISVRRDNFDPNTVTLDSSCRNWTITLLVGRQPVVQ